MLQAVALSFWGTPLFSDVNVKGWSLLAVVGENGSGKTSSSASGELLSPERGRSLAGLDIRPAEGTVLRPAHLYRTSHGVKGRSDAG